MSNLTIRNNDEYPSIEWKQPRAARSVPKNPIGRPLSTSLLVIWVVVIRGLIHLQLNKTFSLEGYGMEVATDPVVWGLGCWTMFMWDDKHEAGVDVGAFDCPHCGVETVANDHMLNGAIGSRWSCWKCNNVMVKRSTPPKLKA